jgi:hypothetical protein
VHTGAERSRSKIMSSRVAGWVGVAVVVLAGARSDAQSDGVAAERRCVPLASIDRSVVVDDRTLLFYMRDKTVLQNRLASACPGLSRENKFSYRVAQSQLCALDAITVLEDRGVGLIQTSSCALGPFSPIDAASAEALRDEGKSAR